MKRLQTVESIVRQVLENNAEARNDDMELFRLVCWKCVELQGYSVNKGFDEVLRNYKKYGIPNFESVRRTRQKIQAVNPELGCSPEVRRARRKAESIYRDYATDKDGQQQED